MSDNQDVPEYATMLAAYHAAFAPELQAMVASLPIAAGDRVLDLACGDGTYSRWLADRVGPGAGVVAVDILPAYLELARDSTRGALATGRVLFVMGALERLPFVDDTFDLVWCAQSLFSLPDPVDSVRRMTRLARPGGVVAVLENDTLHQLILPWPVEVELAVRRAELVAFAKESENPRKYYVGRRLCQVLRAAGLADCRRRTWASDRQAPLGPAERVFLREYLRDLRERIAPHLEPIMLEKVEPILDADSGDSMLDWPDLSITSIDHVVWGVKKATTDEPGSGKPPAAERTARRR